MCDFTKYCYRDGCLQTEKVSGQCIFRREIDKILAVDPQPTDLTNIACKSTYEAFCKCKRRYTAPVTVDDSCPERKQVKS
jgi:hypothetical protein